MSRIKRILNPFFQYGYKIYTSKPRKFRFKDVYTIVQPNVFPPKFTWSTSLLLKHLEEINLENKKLLELGCGSGIIALYAAHKKAQVTATDINDEALQNLKEVSNIQKLKIEIINSDLFKELKGKTFDLIIINPPYYPKNPVSIKEQAWYCGEKFEYFEKLFNQIGDFSANENVRLILSNSCNQERINQIANKNRLEMKVIKTKKSLTETNTIYTLSSIN